MENKQSFFSLRIETELIKNNDYKLEELENSVDIILSTLGVKAIFYKFQQKNNTEKVYFFKTDTRKRNSRINKKS